MDKMIWLKHFEGKSIFITGSTGLIGSAVADILLRTVNYIMAILKSIWLDVVEKG